MELYYRDLISEEASLEKLVDDLMLIVQGADEFAAAAGAGLETEQKEEILSRLEQLKAQCRRLGDQLMATARATDKTMRRYPYSFAGFAFGVGLLVGVLVGRKG